MRIERRIIPYSPRPAFCPYHNRTPRFAVIVAHRRAGKTVACINDLIRSAVLCQNPEPRFAYIAPLYNQAKDVAWAYLKRYAAPVLAGPPNESELRIDLINGARVRLYGADNPDRLRGIYLDGVILDEHADMHPTVWGEVVRPALSDRQGWATFIGTPKGRNDFWRLYERAAFEPGWMRLSLRASETGILPQSELDAARRDMTLEQYEQEFECSFDAAIIGAYYGREIADAEREGRITDVPYDPHYPVHTAWDLGVGDATAIWFFQVVGRAPHVIDYYEAVGQNAAHYVAEVRARYPVGDVYVPHDARQRDWTSGGVQPGLARQRLETLVSMGVIPKMVPSHKIEDGINAARVMMPRIRFDATKCAHGLEALRQYRSEYDEKAKVFRDRPKHDWTSHAADAFRYLCMAYREIMPPPEAKPNMPIGIQGLTFDQYMQIYAGNTGRKWI